MSWFGSEKQIQGSGGFKTGAGADIMRASQNIQNGMVKLGEYNDKQDEKAQFKLEKEADKLTQIQKEYALIKAYEEKHPKFMGKVDKNGKDIPGYNQKTRLEKLALIQMVGNEVINKKSGKVVNVYTGADGHRMAVFDDGSEKKLSKAHIYNNNNNLSLNTTKVKDLGYGFNADGTAKTFKQYATEKNNERLKLKKKKFEKLNKNTGKIYINGKTGNTVKLLTGADRAKALLKLDK
jgi:hypothetical protein